LDIAKKRKVKKVYIHFFADGRDVPEKSAKKYVKMIERKGGKIASIIGRYYSMDRDNNWNRTKKAYDLLTKGKGFKAKSALEAVHMAYKRGDKTDYYIKPTVVVGENGGPVATIQDKDAIIFFNYRTDRPRQLSHALFDKRFNRFKRKSYSKIKLIVMTPYDKTFENIAAFTEEKVRNNLGETVARKGLKQLRLAETEKYAHITYFFNSQIEKPYKGEKRILIPSPKVHSYDLKPEMSAYKIAREAKKQISTKKFDFIVMNFANCDLVGHSAIKKAIIKCVEVVDECIGIVVKSALANDYVVVLTADHGSAEDKIYPNGKPKPAHSTNPVNFVVISDDSRFKKIKLKKKGGQCDVAPTILDIMGIKKPKDMGVGRCLIRK